VGARLSARGLARAMACSFCIGPALQLAPPPPSAGTARAALRAAARPSGSGEPLAACPSEGESFFGTGGSLALGLALSTLAVTTHAHRRQQQRRRREGCLLPRSGRRVAVSTAAAAAPAAAPFSMPGVEGAALEVLGGPATGSHAGGGVTLLLVHGSYRAAWCWEPYFLDFFRSRGFDTYALSLRGQGGSIIRPGTPPPVAGTLEEHASDVAAFAAQLQQLHGRPVAVLGHSFGGLIVQQAVADMVGRSPSLVAGMALLASVPPSGNAGLIGRYLWRSPWLAARITWGFATRAFERDAGLCRELFFESEMADEDVKVYMQRMKDGCPAGTRLLDLRALAGSLPVPAAGSLAGGPAVLVFGGDKDVIVDAEALDETARAHGVTPVRLPGAAHDAMLGPRWRDAAEVLLAWLQRLPRS